MHQRKWNEVAHDVNFNLKIDIERFIQEVPFGSRILDFGCGYGRVSHILWEAGYKNILGIDTSEKMVERGRCQYPELNIEVFSGRNIPYPDNSFDAAIACAVFTCITSREIREHQFKELYRILKPNGLLHMVEFCAEPSHSFTASIGVPMLHSTPQQLRDLSVSLNIVSDEVINSKTMGGSNASSYSLFARRIT
ncbi:MAG: hypothetical protein OFPII_13670 [Osedax symbiont Rs1]|nr:MAG: hypothetical protein OFPII_13670 [Osedax symbiont Rs1]